jgi:hypothetical protein
MLGKSQNRGHFEYPCSVLKVSLNFTKFGTLWEHHQDIPGAPFRGTSGTPIQFVFNFPYSVHCDHTIRNTTKDTVNEPPGDTASTFFGKTAGTLMVSLMGTL